MHGPRCPRLRRCLAIYLIPALTVCLAGCPQAGTETGDGQPSGDAGDTAGGQPLPPEDVVLTVTIEGQGTVEQTASGAVVTLTAIPDVGWEFDGWFGTTMSKVNPLTIQATPETSVSARFTQEETQSDSDADGVPDERDECPGTPVDAEVDLLTGCAESQLDDDGDGVTNAADQCADTPLGEAPNADGCGPSQRDSDDDGVSDKTDRCPDTPERASVDSEGCAESQRDGDGDGVNDDVDECKNTAPETAVDDKGCALCGNGEIDDGEECDPPDNTVCDDECKLMPPVNDACEDATDVTTGAKPLSNERATTDGSAEPTCGFIGGDQIDVDVWFCYTASCDGTATVSLCDAGFDARVAVYSGCDCPTADPIVCNDDGCGETGGGSLVAFMVADDAEYLIRVGGFNDLQGDATLLIACDSGCTSNAQCDDGSYCNGAETCIDGECQAGTAVNCDDGADCTVDSCNEATDSCDNVADNSSCDDGEFCNGAEVCDPTDANADATTGCVAGSDPCREDEFCNEATDACDECQVAADCDDGFACTDDTCVDATCVNTRNDAACDDGEFCNGGETCNPADAGADANGCVAGMNPCEDNVACTDDVCDEGTDTCTNTPNDAECPDDGLFCNGTEFCDSSEGCISTGDPCPAGEFCNEATDACDECQAAANCDDGVDCTDDECVGGACVFTPNDGNCPDDGLFCNGVATCDAATGCQAGTAPCRLGEFCNEGARRCDECLIRLDCDDGALCTDDDCVDGVCVAVPNDALCDDVAFCDGVETCDPSNIDADVDGCVAGADPCDDGIACTVDSCDDVDDVCVHTPDDDACTDDGVFCNGNEVCDAVSGCTHGGDPCVVGQTCNEDTDACEMAPATWSSTQLMLPGANGYNTPELYDLDSAGNLRNALLDISAGQLEAIWLRGQPGQATVLATEIPLGQTIQTYEVFVDWPDLLFPDQTITQTLTINAFNLSLSGGVGGLTATWTFDYTEVRSRSGGPDPDAEESRHYVGTQVGDVSEDGGTITWTGVDGTIQICDLLDPQSPCGGVCDGGVCTSGVIGAGCVTDTDCDIALTETRFPPGTWLRQ